MQNLAHIYKTKTGYQLDITHGDIMTGGYRVISSTIYKTRNEAKQEARNQNARPWNY